MTIGTSSSRCSPRPGARSRAPSSGDIFNPRLVSASSATVHGFFCPSRSGCISATPGRFCYCSRGPLLRLQLGSGSLRSSALAPAVVEPLLSLSACSRCCTNASSSRCMSSSMRALQYATSCFRMYLPLCSGVQTIASGAGTTTAATGGGLTSGSSPMSIHGTPRHFRMKSLSHCRFVVFR